MKRLVLSLFASALVCAAAEATNLTIGASGRVTIELVGADAAFRNTLSIASPTVAIAVTGCKLEPAVGLSGVQVLSEKTSQHGCRVELDSDPATPGIQGFAAGTTFEFKMCAKTSPGPNCSFVWSSNKSSNPDNFDHVKTTEVDPVNFPGQIYRLAWEDTSGGGDQDFNDLIAQVRVNMDSDGDGLWDDWERFGIDVDGDGVIDVDLPAMGANPMHKDIFIEVDWMDCAVAGGDCAAGDTHNHKPKPAAIAACAAASVAAANRSRHCSRIVFSRRCSSLQSFRCREASSSSAAADSASLRFSAASRRGCSRAWMGFSCVLCSKAAISTWRVSSSIERR